MDKFLMKYLNNKPEEGTDEAGRRVRPSRKYYLDFVWTYLNDGEINYGQLKNFSLKEGITTPSFFGEESHADHDHADFNIVINSVKADFEPERIADEEHLEAQLMVFLKAKFPERKIRRQITIQGNDRLDVLVDDRHAFELKVPKQRSDLRNLGAQLSEYKESYPNICAVIYDLDDLDLSDDIADYVDRYKRDHGIHSILLGGKRRR